MTASEWLQFVNLLIVPVLIYVIKLERQLAVMGEWKRYVDAQLIEQAKEVIAAHRRLDRLHAPAAAADR